MRGQRRRSAGSMTAPLQTQTPVFTSANTATPESTPHGLRYLDAGEVATAVGLSRESVLRAWRSGALAGYAVNRKVVRFTFADVTAWMATGRRQQPTPKTQDSLRPTPRSRPRRKAA